MNSVLNTMHRADVYFTLKEARLARGHNYQCKKQIISVVATKIWGKNPREIVRTKLGHPRLLLCTDLTGGWDRQKTFEIPCRVFFSGNVINCRRSLPLSIVSSLPCKEEHPFSLLEFPYFFQFTVRGGDQMGRKGKDVIMSMMLFLYA